MVVIAKVNIPFFTKYINEEEKFVSDESLNRSAHAMISELIKWHEVLTTFKNRSAH